MRRIVTVACGALALAAAEAGAQQMRRRGPDAAAAPEGAPAPRDARFPYAGTWVGTRVMPIGTDRIGLRFRVVDGRYAGETLHPDGGTAPQRKLAASSAGLTWEQPNSGGGTWVFVVRLVAPDSLAGTIVLRDAPPDFDPVPRGTLSFVRQPARR
jgi:hypothetical protein